MEKKTTNKMALEFVLGLDTVKENTEIFEKLTKMLEQVEKKNSSVDKDGKKVLTPTQKDNEKIKMILMGVLKFKENAQQIKEIMEHERIKPLGLSNQKISALLRQMLNDGTAYRLEEKKVAKFYLCETPILTEIEYSDENVEE